MYFGDDHLAVGLIPQRLRMGGRGNSAGAGIYARPANEVVRYNRYQCRRFQRLDRTGYARQDPHAEAIV